MLLKHPATTCNLQGRRQTSMLDQVMKQELKDAVPPERREDKMSSSKLDYLATYKNNYITDIQSHSSYRYTLINNEQGVCKILI